MTADETQPSDWQVLYQQLQQEGVLKLWDPHTESLGFRTLRMEGDRIRITYGRHNLKGTALHIPEDLLRWLILRGETYTNYWHAYAAHLQWKSHLKSSA